MTPVGNPLPMGEGRVRAAPIPIACCPLPIAHCPFLRRIDIEPLTDDPRGARAVLDALDAAQDQFGVGLADAQGAHGRLESTNMPV
jgi:hypothetical protein